MLDSPLGIDINTHDILRAGYNIASLIEVGLVHRDLSEAGPTFRFVATPFRERFRTSEMLQL